MTKIILHEQYPNDFMTLHTGEVFYKKNNSLGINATPIDVDLDSPKNFAIKELVKQGLLVTVNESSAKIIDDKPSKDSLKEVKTKKNDEELSQVKQKLDEPEAKPEAKE